MFSTRILCPALLNSYRNPYISIQEKGHHAKSNFVMTGKEQKYDKELQKKEDLLVNKKFLEVLKINSQATSFKAADCTLNTEEHAAFAKVLRNLQVVILERGTISSVALNALIKNSPNLKVLSLRGEDITDGPIEQYSLKHPQNGGPKRLPELQGKHLGLFELRGYSSISNILEYIKGATIDRLVLTPRLMDFNVLNTALEESEVHEIEFDSTFSEAIKVPDNLENLNNLKETPIRLKHQSVTGSQLAEIVAGFGNQITTLDLSESRELQARDLEILTEKCSKLDSLSLFECILMCSEENPNSIELTETLKKVVKLTQVKHIVLGWDNDLGGPTYRNGPDPKDLIKAERLSATLSEAANRPVKVTVTNWYPTSKMMDDYT